MCAKDYNVDGFMDGADVPQWDTIFLAHQSLETGDLCTGQQTSLVTAISGGLALTAVDCENGAASSANYCDAAPYSDLLGTVTLSTTFADFTGLEAIVKITNTTGATVPDFWRFDDELAPCGFNNGAGGYNRFSGKIATINQNYEPNGDPNCIWASSAYAANPFIALWSVLEAVWPDPISGLSSEEQIRILYARVQGLGSLDEGFIAANSPTIVFGLRIPHSGHVKCSGCEQSSQILFSIEQVTLTTSVPGKNPPCAPQQIGRTAANHVNDQPQVIVITPHPTTPTPCSRMARDPVPPPWVDHHPRALPGLHLRRRTLRVAGPPSGSTCRANRTSGSRCTTPRAGW